MKTFLFRKKDKPAVPAEKNGGEGKAGSSFLTVWLPFFLALAVHVLMMVLGRAILPKRRDHLYQILWLCDAAAIILCYVVTWLFLRRIKLVYGKQNLPEIHKALLEKQTSIEADLSRASARVRRAIRFAWVWYVLTVALACVNSLLVIPASLPIPVALLGIYILWGLLSVWFGREKTAPPELELSEKDYPVLTGLVRQAAAAADCRLPVRVFSGGQSVGIVRRPKEVWILLDSVTCALFTKSELYQSLLHEFAHEINEDTLQSLRIEQELSRWGNAPEGVLTGIGGYLLNLPAGLISLEYTFYDLFSSRHKEMLADAGAVSRGSARELVNGLAKLSVWGFFESDTPVPELSLYAEYSGEEPMTDIPARALRIYREMLPEKREEWRRRLDVELPPRISSHPIFRQRREAFGIEEYSFETAETDEAYLAETAAMLDLTGRAVAKQMAQNYEEIRKHEYLDRKELIDRAKAVTDWTAVSIDERIKMAKALAILEPELEETVIQSIRTQEPDNVYGIMLLGARRYRENDPACVELLKKAAKENFNFVEPAFDLLGKYTLASGRQDLLDEYRAEVAEAVQTSWDTDEALQIHWKGNERLLKNDLPQDRFDANRDAIAERSEGKLTHLYSVRTDTAKGPCFHYFLEFPADLSAEEQDRLYHQVFLYLDYLPDEEYYSLRNVTGETKKIAYLLHHVPDCEIPLNAEQGRG